MSLMKQLLKYSASEISDAMDSMGLDGVIKQIKPIKSNHQIAGPVYTVCYEPYSEKPETFQKAGDYIDDIPEGAVVVIDNGGRDNCTVWGNILTATAQKKKLAGTIVFGVVRDIHQIIALDYPVFSLGAFMKSGKNRVKLVSVQEPIQWGDCEIQPNDMIFADQHGGLVIPNHLLNEVIKRAQIIHDTEEKILEAVKNGMSLKIARQTYHYHKPWLKNDEY